MASPLSALHMKASDSCKIQVTKNEWIANHELTQIHADKIGNWKKRKENPVDPVIPT